MTDGNDNMITETKRRGPIYAEYRGPGPLAYKLAPTTGQKDHDITKNMAPAYSIGLPVEKGAHPGPEFPAVPDNITSKGKQEAPSFSLQSRTRQKGLEISPGPGSYDAQNIKQGTLSHEKCGPAASMGQRSTYQWKNHAPAPTRYNIPTTLGKGSVNRPGAPAWSFKPRNNVGSASYYEIKKGTPGPAMYGATAPDYFRCKSGVFSIQGRTKVKDYNSIKDNPGPGSYTPGNLTRSNTGFSMGIRHSDYIIPYISNLDII